MVSRALDLEPVFSDVKQTHWYGGWVSAANDKGIGNLYEFDCGNESGWMYSVNGIFPNYGCSQHKPQDGDVICWVYTCDLGCDVGDSDWADENSHS